MKHCGISILVAVLLSMKAAVAQTVVIELTDQAGEPLPNAALLMDKNNLSVNPELVKVIDQVDKQFTPTVSAVSLGSDVVFPNSDNIRHNVYSFSDAKTFELKLYSDQERPTVRFDTPGVVTLGCNIHDQMIAYVVVTDDVGVAITDPQGRVELELEGTGVLSNVRIWHYWMGDTLAAAQSITLTQNNGRYVGQVPVTPPVKEKKEPSRLEQRFKRTGH